MRTLRAILPLLLMLSALAPALPASGDVAIEYMDRRRRLGSDDVEGRLALADWCGQRGLSEQRIDLLTEVVDLRPDDDEAYRALLAADAKRVRPVDRAWAGRLEALLGDRRYRLHHSPHFTLLTDVDEATAAVQLEALEAAYQTFYAEVPAVGLRPMPPKGRLVCVLFGRRDDFRDWMRRFEGMDIPWGAGHYSWRTNRTSFFHDADSPVFADVREKLGQLSTRRDLLKAELAGMGAGQTARKLELQREIKRLNEQHADLTGRFAAAGKLGTLSKTRHEVAHQLLHNSGIQARGKPYPWWLNEGLATLLESADATGRASPRLVNTYRLAGYRQLEEDGKLPSLAALLEYRPGERDEAQLVADHYGVAWSLAHFLWNRRPAQLRAYLAAHNQPSAWRQDPAALFARHFGDDPAEIEKQWREHVRAMAPQAADAR